MENNIVTAQRRVLNAVRTLRDPNLYLVGGTALALRFHHRLSEDLDFFTQSWSRQLPKRIAERIRTKTGFPGRLINETVKPGLAKIAIYNFQVSKKLILKVDVVEDFERLLLPIGKDGIASVDDIYLRKIRAAIGWMGKISSIGRPMPGGRQAARDLYDLWYLSEHQASLSIWFPQHFGREDYERLTGWLQRMTTQATILELMNTAPGCDTRRIRQHLENQIFDRLNRIYIRP